ncbi:hypothetical protein KZP23_08860 [Echinicola marina]|uniref:hypothetical protein n=1 Tax=Echinicola marina TaxID=2859768 RepID=UPI001CF6B5EC|nr:hypothetical protein [Echinicola marina]UCS95104.1 hypothetical protein KZP23_08860 [Echinicola marina]
MNASLKKERIRWAIVILIGLIASLIISEWEKKSKTPSNLSQTNDTSSIGELRQPIEQIFLPIY